MERKKRKDQVREGKGVGRGENCLRIAKEGKIRRQKYEKLESEGRKIRLEWKAKKRRGL